MSTTTREPRPSPNPEVEALLAECIERLEAGGEPAVEEVLAAHPEHADELGELLGSLRGVGLVRDAVVPERDIGGFRPLRKIGAGGMGTVYLARQASVDRMVALKVVRAGLAASGKAAERFRREARAIAQLRHPNIVAVYDTGDDDGLLYTAMEFVPGRGLDEVLAEDRELETAQVVTWIRDVARALASAHAAGVVHRDVKPSNIRIARDGRAMLLDFGLARNLEGDTITLTGSYQGSPRYSSPEQIRAGKEPIGPATDVYSLGVTLYEALTGRAPFEGETTEQVFHEILTRDPPRPRGLNPAVSRDLETVVLCATAREPRRRYRTVQAFADDLDALLSFRPIAARPPGALELCAKWIRRNPVAAAVGLTALVALVFVVIFQRWWTLSERRADARAALASAAKLLDEYASQRDVEGEREARFLSWRRTLESKPHDPEEWKAYDAERVRIDKLRGKREDRFADALTYVDLATSLDPDLSGVDDVRAELYLHKWHLARAVDDTAGMEFYQRKVEEHDARGVHSSAFDALGRVSLRSRPARAEVFLQRYVLQSEVVPGGEPRLVPAPVSGPPPINPGTWCLRVVADAGDLRRGDLLFEVAGHAVQGLIIVTRGGGDVRPGDVLENIDGRVPRDLFDVNLFARGEDGVERTFAFARGSEQVVARAANLGDVGIEITDARGLAERGGGTARVLRDGTVLETPIPEGLDTRVTAAPLLLTTACRVGLTPTPALELEEGNYVAVLRLKGHEETRRAFEVRAGKASLLRNLLPERGTSLPGFVHVPMQTTEVTSFWLQEREVTCDEYLEFLNDPESLATIDSAGTPVLYPRTPANAFAGGSWPRGDDGRFTLPADGTPDMPVLGVSLGDACTYARWLTARAERSGVPWNYDLPGSYDEIFAATGIRSVTDLRFRRYYVGPEFRPHWFKTCFARDVACVEPVMSYPRDETPYGVFDLAGSAAEWTLARWNWADYRVLVGGSWDQGFPEWFQTGFAHGNGENATAFNYGFRLVARPVEQR